jgi:hypothetical protein
MANLTWIIFGIFVACCSAHFGFDRPGQNNQQRYYFRAILTVLSFNAFSNLINTICHFIIKEVSFPTG